MMILWMLLKNTFDQYSGIDLLTLKSLTCGTTVYGGGECHTVLQP